MGHPTKTENIFGTQTSENCINMLVEIVVCLKYLDRNDNKINELIKKKIIDKSAVLIKKKPKQKLFVATTSYAITK